MRTAKKKDELYEISLRNRRVNLKKSAILLPSFKSKIQHFTPTSVATPVATLVSDSITSDVPIIVDSPVCIENDLNLQYVKSKIMIDYSNLYKTV